LAPILAALALTVTMLMTSPGCGRGIFPFASTSASGSVTITPTPGTGAFLYATNFNDGKIAEFSRNPSTGALSLIGDVQMGTGGIMGVAITPNNNFLYVVDSNANKIYQFRINLSTGALTGLGSTVTGTTPQQVAIDASGKWVFVTNLGGSVSQYVINTDGTLKANGSVAGFSGRPFGIVAHPSAEFIYVSDNTAGLIYAYSIDSTGNLTEVGSPIPSRGTIAGTPGLMAIGSDSTGTFFLFADDPNNGSVSSFQIQPNGSLTFGMLSNPQSGKPVGIAVATQTVNGVRTDYLFTANQTGNVIIDYTRQGAQFQEVNATTDANAPTGIIVDPQNAFVYTGNFGNATVVQLQLGPACGTATLCVVTSFATEKSGTGGGTEFLAITH
jgi:6-phosphogluconolactonase (cycloisomerase 2 family)